jgi:uncharacterized protein YbgA (DUF1722 family)
MRVWDVAAGYLSRQSLLGEHRELHGLYSILIHGKRGYSRHPETIRWIGCANALVRRHDLLVAEMRLRGYLDRTPLVKEARRRIRWPLSFVTDPADQFVLLDSKYAGSAAGRIRLPRTTQELWAQHKYSVLARDPARYRETGRRTARLRGLANFAATAQDLVAILREPPAPGRLANAVEHMWGYVAPYATPSERREAQRSLAGLFRATQVLAARHGSDYLVASTALSELSVYLRHKP